MTLQGLLDVTPILMLIALGVVVRATGLIDQRSGLVLTRLAYYVTIPAAIFSSIARSRLTLGMIYLPAIGLAVPLLLAGLMYLTTRYLAQRPEQRGVMMVAMVVLGVFGYPFFQLFYGAEGLVRMAMYDVGNSIYAGTVALMLAQRYGSRSTGAAISWRKVVGSPVLCAAVFGVLCSLLRVPIGGPIGNFLDRLTAANTALAMIAVGVFVRPRAAYGRLVAQTVLLRMVLGSLMGWAVALLLGMDGLDLILAFGASLLPCGTTALIYAGNEGLDTEFAASLISASVIVSAVLINILPHLLARLYL